MKSILYVEDLTYTGEVLQEQKTGIFSSVISIICLLALCTAVWLILGKKEEVVRNWYERDAEGKVLGKLATEIAVRLMGKHKPSYTPHVDGGDFVIILNADKIAVTGNKLLDKKYYRHSGYPGGLKVRNLEEMLQKQPTEVIRKAVERMLPKNKLGSQMINRLRLFTGTEHTHTAQKPERIEL